MSEITVKSKREIIAENIEAGGATMESLMAAADCKYESVMSNFSMLRLMGKCPVKDVETDGVLTYRFVTSEEWEKIKASKIVSNKRPTVTKSPAQRLIAAEKRTDKCEKVVIGAVKRATANTSDILLDLRAQKAEVEFQIAKFELEEAKKAVIGNTEAEAEYDALISAAHVPEATGAGADTDTDADAGANTDSDIDAAADIDADADTDVDFD